MRDRRCLLDRCLCSPRGPFVWSSVQPQSHSTTSSVQLNDVRINDPQTPIIYFFCFPVTGPVTGPVSGHRPGPVPAQAPARSPARSRSDLRSGLRPGLRQVGMTTSLSKLYPCIAHRKGSVKLEWQHPSLNFPPALPTKG